MESLALFAAGLLPAILIAFLGHRFIFRKSRLPASKAILAAMLGIISALPAYYIEGWADQTISADFTSWWQVLTVAFMTVALIEELFKGAMLWISNYVVPIDEPIDMLCISLLIAMGFAGVENILYSYSKGWEVALFRSLTAVPAHACFAIILAYFPAMEFPHRKTITPYLQGLLLAWLLHGAYDFFILQDISEPLMLMALVVLLVCCYMAYSSYYKVWKLSFASLTEVAPDITAGPAATIQEADASVEEIAESEQQIELNFMPKESEE